MRLVSKPLRVCLIIVCRIMKSQWRLFHKDFTNINADKPVYLCGVNEYMTQQNAIHLVIDQFPAFDVVY